MDGASLILNNGCVIDITPSHGKNMIFYHLIEDIHMLETRDHTNTKYKYKYFMQLLI